MEWYLHEGHLIDEDAWRVRIQTLRASVATGDMAGVIDTAVQRRIPDGQVAVLFSGGVDSTLIARLLEAHHADLTCYTVGFHDEGQKEPDDVQWAKRVAQHFRWRHKTIMLDFVDAERIIRRCVDILGTDDVVNIGVGTVEVAAYAAIMDDGIRDVFGGIGSEEIFAGYKRHRDAQDPHEECWRGLLAMRTRDLVRESAIARAFSMQVHTPLLDEDVIRCAMAIPIEKKLDSQTSKIILRDIAQRAGISIEFAQRPKQAAQYGSRIDRAIGKLAKRAGCARKDEYLRSLRSR
ncbi:MAG: asparagine synthase C-terminal domain-containing protein [Nanoarchaeota archaeon]